MKYKSLGKYFLFVFLCVLFINISLFAAEQLPFKDGEKLTFSLKWMGMIGGKSTIEVKEEVSCDSGESSYLLNATLKTVGLADVLFKIRDSFASLITINSKRVSPVWWEVVKKEKSYEYQKKTDFKDILKEEPKLQSPLSALYVFRLSELDVGDKISMPVFIHKKISPLKIKVVSKEPLKIYGKSFDTILVDVALEGSDIGISSTKLKDFKIWLTDDEKRLPIFMKANTSAGVITVILDNRKELLEEN